MINHVLLSIYEGPLIESAGVRLMEGLWEAGLARSAFLIIQIAMDCARRRGCRIVKTIPSRGGNKPSMTPRTCNSPRRSPKGQFEGGKSSMSMQLCRFSNEKSVGVQVLEGLWEAGLARSAFCIIKCNGFCSSKKERRS